MKTEALQLHGYFGTAPGQISSRFVKDKLALMGAVDELVIDIESKGGDVWEGLGVYRALKDFPARKIVNVTYAMSVGSWVAMVGDEINIAENGMFMIHASRLRPAEHCTEEELMQHAATVRQMNEQMADTYAARTGRPKDQILTEMKATTWLKGKDAVTRGFATKVMPNRSLVAQFSESDLTDAPEWVRTEFQPGIVNQVEEIPVTEPVVPAVVETPPVVAPEPVPVVVPPIANVVDVPALENAATIRERGRIRDVTAACTMAGCTPEVTNSFIDRGLGIDAVRVELFPTLCATRKPIGESGATPAESIVNQADAKLEAEWASVQSTVTNMGVAKEIYFASRRQDLATTV